MNDDSKQQDGQNPTPDRGREFAARRKIVKGMASAVPVVMTIGCGQAMANGSSLRCIRPVVPPPPECIALGEDDGYVRVNTAPENCPQPVEGSLFQEEEVDPFATIDTTDTGRRGRNNRENRENTVESIAPTTQQEPLTVDEPDKRRLMYVNADGTPTGNNSDFPVTWSCYGSFMDTAGLSEPETVITGFGSKKGAASDLPWERE